MEITSAETHNMNIQYSKFMREEELKLQKELREKLKAVNSRLRKKYDPKNIFFEVWILSLWEDHGEKSTKLIGIQGDNLEITFKEAQESFKKTNNRSDVQGKYSVYVKGNGTSYTVPQEHYKHLIEQKTNAQKPT